MSTRNDGIDEETVGRILEWLNRANLDRQEMKTDLSGVQSSLREIDLKLGRQENLLDQIDKRTSILDGKNGLENRVYLAEAQIKVHEKFIQNVTRLGIKIISAAVAGGALSGFGTSHLYHLFFND